jgi:hypothetical protein
MNITLSTYKPFSNTQELMAYGKKNWESPSADLIDLVQKIGKLAVTILALLPTLLLDLSLSCFSYVYQACYQEDTKVNITPNPPSLAIAAPTQPAAKLKKDPTQDQIDKINRQVFQYRAPNNQTFFKEALDNALDFAGANSNKYQKLIRDQGVAEDEEEDFVDIFKWSAECLVIHWLRVKNKSMVIPFSHFPYTRLDAADPNFSIRLLALSAKYENLSEKDRATAVMQIILPHEEWNLTESSLTFIRDLQGIAMEITRVRDYNLNICGPVSRTY